MTGTEQPELGALLGRRLSYEIVLLHTEVGRRLGLSAPDHKYLDVIARDGPVTAGRLGELTGLSSGAVTAAIDRLERGGFVERGPDPRDRRRVVVTASGPRVAEIGALMAPLGAGVAEFLPEYTDEQLAVVASFLARLLDTVRDVREAIAAGPPAPDG